MPDPMMTTSRMVDPMLLLLFCGSILTATTTYVSKNLSLFQRIPVIHQSNAIQRARGFPTSLHTTGCGVMHSLAGLGFAPLALQGQARARKQYIARLMLVTSCRCVALPWELPHFVYNLLLIVRNASCAVSFERGCETRRYPQAHTRQWSSQAQACVCGNLRHRYVAASLDSLRTKR